MGLVAKAFQDIITFSRASSGTYVNSNGYITNSSVLNYLTYSNQPENAAWTKSNSFVQQNLVLYSEQFDNVAWAKTLTTITANAVVAPDGTLTADRFVSSGGAFPQIAQSVTLAAGDYTLSVWVLSDGTPQIAQTLLLDGTGAVFTPTTTWTRVTVTKTGVLAGSRAAVIATNNGAAPASSFYIWGAQLVQGSVPGDYRATTSAALPCLYADYTGALRARKICEDAANSQHYWSEPTAVTAGVAYTVSFRVKAAEKTQIVYTWNVAGSAFNTGNATFNLSAGTVTPGGAATGTITALGSGWYLCTTTNTCVTTSAASAHYLAFTALTTYVGDGTSGVYIADVQVNDGLSALAYYDTTASAYNAPRFDYDPVTLAAKGLLVEESRANLLLQSNDFLTSWTPVNITRTLNSILSPSGNVDGVKIAATAAAATSILQTANVAATSATFSVYVKQGTGATTANNFGLRNVTTLTNLVFGTLNYSTGVFTYTTGSTGVVVTNAGNGWWRIAITATTGITSGDLCTGYVGFIGNAQAAGDFLYAYGAQLEGGAFATSYIPTVASQVTRAADVASVNTLSPWFNSVASTVYIELQAMWTTGGTGSDRSAWSVSGGTNPLLGIVRASGGSIQFHDETTYRTMPNGVYNDASIRKVAIALADPALTANAAINGTNGTVTTDGSTLDAGTTAFNIGATSIPNGFWCGWIRRFTYYPRQMTLAECSTLTTL